MKILNIQRMSTEDGPGLRTSLFVKGCPLSCRWCHNPESIPVNSHIEWIGVRCIGCGSCAKVCKQGALLFENEIKIDHEKCALCGACIEACPTGALEKKGEEVTVEELFAELIKDKAYWGKDGGVTLSGGEILLQYAEAAKLLKLLKERGVNTAVDTCGLCKKEAIDMVFPYTDIFLYDIKLISEEEHKKHTGQSNRVIKENFLYLAEKIKNTDKKIWVRTPIIPGATDTDENIAGIGAFLENKADVWEMCAFNNLCKDKYERLYLSWMYEKASLMTKQRMEELTELAKKQGVKNVRWTGLTRKED